MHSEYTETVQIKLPNKLVVIHLDQASLTYLSHHPHPSVINEHT